MKKGQKIRFLAYTSSILLILLLWQVMSCCMKSPLVLPEPKMVFVAILKIMETSAFWISYFVSISRVLISFVISTVLGCIAGYFCSRSDFFRNFMEIPLSVIRSTPVIAIILLSLFWFTSNTLPVFVSVLMAFPIITTAVMYGFMEKQEDLMFMAECFCYSKYKIFRYIKLPACKPFFLNGIETSFGICWKVVIAGEVLCVPRYACGSLLQSSQIMLETDKVIAVTIMLIITSFLFQGLLFKLIKRGVGSEKRSSS